MNDSTNILARMRRRKTGGAFYAMVLLLAAQLAAAVTPCFAIGADGSRAVYEAVARASTVPHADAAPMAEPAHAHHGRGRHAHGAVSAQPSQGSHGSGAGNAPHASHSAADHQATEPDNGPHCPHCPGGVPANGGLTHDGQQKACATVELVDTAPQHALEHSLKPPYSMASALPIPLFPRPSARASPPREPPPVPIAVPLNIRHCVFLI